MESEFEETAEGFKPIANQMKGEILPGITQGCNFIVVSVVSTVSCIPFPSCAWSWMVGYRFAHDDDAIAVRTDEPAARGCVASNVFARPRYRLASINLYMYQWQEFFGRID